MMSTSPEMRRWYTEQARDDATALAEAQTQLDAALAREAEARRTLDEVACLRNGLQDLVRSRSRRLGQSRYALSRLCVAALPDDVLCCIFETVLRDYSRVIHVPHVLACVCKHWRTVALNLPILWSYISIELWSPTNTQPEALDLLYDRVMNRLSRSRGAPLHIRFSWHSHAAHSSPTLDAISDILEALGRHAMRWETASITVPTLSDRDSKRFSLLECLRGPTPLLKVLGLVAEPDWPLQKGYLPFAPALRSLEIEDLRISYSPHTAFPALTNIELSGDRLHASDIYELLLHAAPALEELELRALRVEFDVLPRAKISLSALRDVRLGPGSQALLCEPVGSWLHTPTLKALSFCHCAPDDALIPFLDTVSPTVRHLAITGRLSIPLSLTHVDVLQHLQEVEELAFDHDPLGSEGPFWGDLLLLDRLAATPPTLWPRMSCIKLPYASGMEEQLLSMISARNSSPAPDGRDRASPAARPWSRLERVQLGRLKKSHWLHDEIERLFLRARCLE